MVRTLPLFTGDERAIQGAEVAGRETKDDVFPPKGQLRDWVSLAGNVEKCEARESSRYRVDAQ